MKAAVQRVETALRALGIAPRIVEFADSTRTAEEAARAIGTEVPRIVKSLVFLAAEDPVLALVSGCNRVSLDKLAAALAAPVRRADAATVRAYTGYAIGGVPPVGHANPLPVLLDRDLLIYDLVYAAAGTPNAIFPITPANLLRITGARPIDLRDEETPS